MATYAHSGDESFRAQTGFYVPYSHMDDKDAELFYTCMGVLLSFANQRLGINEMGPLVVSEPENHMLTEAGGRVSEELWKHRELVADFVRENPCGLTMEQLSVVAPWRYALRDVFVVIAANEDCAVYMNDDHLFAIGAMQDNADSHIHTIPSLLLLTLLPFEDGIVDDGKVIFLSDTPREKAIPLIKLQAHNLISEGVISTSVELINYSSALPDENRVPPLYQEAIDSFYAEGGEAQ